MLKWYQTKEKLFITIDATDVTKLNVDLKPEGKLHFSGLCPTKELELDLELFGEIIVEKSRWNSKGRNVIILIEKKAKDKFWPRLKKDDKKDFSLQIDWTNWRDEDDDEKKPGAEWDESGMKKFDDQPEFKSDSDDDDAPEEKGKGIIKQSI